MMNMLLKSLVLVVVFSALISGVARLTAPRIVEQQHAYTQRQLSVILPQGSYDPPLQRSMQTLAIEGIPEPATIYLARKNQQPVAVLIDLITPDGYSGDIRLLVAVDVAGRIIASRILTHKETPGLGDAIDADKSDWMKQFEGQSLTTVPKDQWRPDRQGGAFDTISSATITSKAVTSALARALMAYEQQHQIVWENTGP